MLKMVFDAISSIRGGDLRTKILLSIISIPAFFSGPVFKLSHRCCLQRQTDVRLPTSWTLGSNPDSVLDSTLVDVRGDEPLIDTVVDHPHPNVEDNADAGVSVIR